MTPMMKQYLEIKSQYPGTLLMFRLGDFYELFLEDAKTASAVLEITLTGRDAGSQGRIPMCGVPFHSVDQYIARLIDKGYSVAICEQMEDPRLAKGLVKREVIRVVTPGTALPETGAANRYLACVTEREDRCGLCLADVGTGEIYTDEFSDLAACVSEIVAWQPVELLVYEEEWDKLQKSQLQKWLEDAKTPVTRRTKRKQRGKELTDLVCAQYHVPDLTPLDLQTSPLAAETLGMVLEYVLETQKLDLNHFRQPLRIRQQKVMQLDKTVLTNLEVLETVRTRKQTGSLYGLLHRTKTAMGSRLLKHWLERPLLDLEAIVARQEAVGDLVDNFFLRNHIQGAMESVYDLERLVGRVSFGSANARDLQAIAQSLLQLPDIVGMLEKEPVSLFQTLLTQVPDVSILAEEINKTLVEDPPFSVREGGLIAEGVDASLDELRTMSRSGKTWLANLEQRERERTGIRSLKVGYNKVFGYYIEVSKAHLQSVPEDYERRQTLVQAERYVLPELKEHEAKILHAEENAVEREYELFAELRNKVRGKLQDLQRIADALAEIDLLCAFASVSVEGGYVRPAMREKRGIHISGGRHPVVEAQMKGQFVPNDVSLDDERQLILITGPNMAGKSTFMRQTALIVLLSHIGCFVPAKSAEIGLVDRIFTRIGASDDLGGGQSTFMVEMVELAQVLRQATRQSLVLLDEIGRGTSTYDGMSIAEAVMETLSEKTAPLTLFATHYHELTETAETMNHVVNASVLVKEEGDSIAFLHTVVERPADQSYGIQVAKLAGVPDTVIRRAQELLLVREAAGDSVFAHQGTLGVTEAEEEVAAAGDRRSADNRVLTADRTLAAGRDVLQSLAGMDVMTLTPIEAMNKLYELVEKAKGVVTWDKSK